MLGPPLVMVVLLPKSMYYITVVIIQEVQPQLGIARTGPLYDVKVLPHTTNMASRGGYRGGVPKLNMNIINV